MSGLTWEERNPKSYIYKPSKEMLELRLRVAERNKDNKLYEIQFPYFFEAMMKEMERHYPKKGDSYHECSVEYLEKLLRKSLTNYKKLGSDYPRKASQTIDIANICAMLYQRLCGI